MRWRFSAMENAHRRRFTGAMTTSHPNWAAAPVGLADSGQALGQSLRTAVTLGATLTMGLMAGLFAAFSYAVMTGLARTDDRTFIAAMQRINVSILNGWFALCFGGALLLTALAVPLHLRGQARRVLPWLLVALALYLAVLVITAAVNVPLNNTLDAAGDPLRIADPAAVRAHFEAVWVRWNVVRSVASTAAFGSLCWALVQTGRLGA